MSSVFALIEFLRIEAYGLRICEANSILRALPRELFEIVKIWTWGQTDTFFTFREEGVRLSRNYSFADKQERTVGRSKVVRKFLFRNFLPPEVKKE